MMDLIINQRQLTDEIKSKIYKGFDRHSQQMTGTNGLAEEPISFEIFQGSEFVGAIVVQPFWGQLHIKYLFVEEPYRGQGIANKLMNHALDFGKKRGYSYAFVETMSFQAPEFYQKFGFEIEFSRTGLSQNTSFLYLKKKLSNKDQIFTRHTRTGIYGACIKGQKILTITQKAGPYANKHDFPGGGIEFGESVEQTLRREFAEEVGMTFESMELLNNLTVVVDVPATPTRNPYTFYQIGMIYRIFGVEPLPGTPKGDLSFQWVDIKNLKEQHCSPFLWKILQY